LIATDTTIQIAGLAAGVRCGDAKLAAGIRDLFPAFVSRDAPRFHIDVESTATRTDAVAFEARRVSSGAYGFTFDGVDVSVDIQRGIARVKRLPDPQAFYFLFKTVLALELIESRGFMLHASGVVRGEAGFLFTGPSEAGKTTIARQSAADTVLSDECVAVRETGNRWMMYGTPFWGEMRGTDRDASAETTGCFFLRKDTQNTVRRVDAFEAVSRLLTGIYCPFIFPETAGKALETCMQFANTVPVAELGFTTPVTFWGLVDDFTGACLPLGR
jgi:hypothetical protein